MRALTLAACGLAGAALLVGCKNETAPKAAEAAPAVAAPQAKPEAKAESKPMAEAVPSKPGLAVGDAAPAVQLTNLDGTSVSLASLYSEGPLVVTFYRGEWCPYCNKALAGWEERLGELKAAGARIIAVSPEKPEMARKTVEKSNLTYQVLTDADQSAAKAFKVIFTMDDSTKKKYQGYGIDLAAANASGTWELPAPGTFVIVPDGKGGGVVKYAYAEWDYKERANMDEVIAAVKASVKK